MNIKMMHRATASLLIGLCGALVMLGIVVDICFRGAKNCLTGITSEIIFAFVGAAIAGAVFSWFFGQNGRKGWGLASVGALLCTALGAAVGTGLEMGPENALIGIVFVYEVLIMGMPMIGLFWLAYMAATHVLLRAVRRKYFKTTPNCDSS